MTAPVPVTTAQVSSPLAGDQLAPALATKLSDIFCPRIRTISSVSSGKPNAIVTMPVCPLLRVILAARFDPLTNPAVAATVDAWLALVAMYQRSAVYPVVDAGTAKLALAPAPLSQTSNPPLSPMMLRHDSGEESNACAAAALAAAPSASPNVENPASVESHEIV